MTAIKSIIEQIHTQPLTKHKACYWYKLLVPELQQRLHQDTPLTDPQLIKLVNAITLLSPIGTKRNNFKKRYMDSRETILTLPQQPNHSMYDCWWMV
ncbi:hypothetical protein [Vibrio jasicida]|uniref:hypothetical protein n=1 Tax=Vibrio jasicida TaxID=766224 RepID=UPI0005EDD4B1|nr:hypothetical protein [Vibrio jasicida]